MQIKYSSVAKDTLLDILDKKKHLGDFDCFLKAAENIQTQLLNLRTRTDWCLSQLKQKVGSLESDIASAKAGIAEAEKSIQSASKSAAKGERKEKTTAEREAIAKQSIKIGEQNAVIADCTEQLSVLKEKEKALKDGQLEIDKTLQVVDRAFFWLNAKKRDAQDGCEEVKESIQYAATCMENYDAVRLWHDGYGGISRISPKEGW